MELTTYQKFVMKELETSKKILLKKLDIIHEWFNKLIINELSWPL